MSFFEWLMLAVGLVVILPWALASRVGRDGS